MDTDVNAVDNGVEVEEAPQDSAPQGDDQGAQHQEGDFIPKARFYKVYGQFAEYKKFGKMDEVRSKLEKLAQWEKAVEQHRSQGTQGDETRQIREQLYKIAPELKALEKFGSIEQQLSAMQEATVTARMDKASGYLGDKLKTMGFQVTQQEQDELEILLWHKMSPDEQEEFKNGDFSIIDSILSKTKSAGVFGRLGAKTPPKAPTRMGPTGGPKPPSSQQPKGKTWDEASDIGWEKMKEALNQ